MSFMNSNHRRVSVGSTYIGSVSKKLSIALFDAVPFYLIHFYLCKKRTHRKFYVDKLIHHGVKLSFFPSCKSKRTSSIALDKSSCISGAVSPASWGGISFSNLERSRFTTRPHRLSHASRTRSLRIYSPFLTARRNSRSLISAKSLRIFSPSSSPGELPSK